MIFGAKRFGRGERLLNWLGALARSAVKRSVNCSTRWFAPDPLAITARTGALVETFRKHWTSSSDAAVTATNHGVSSPRLRATTSTTDAKSMPPKLLRERLP